MNYKIEGAIRKTRKKFIICSILWLILVIVFVAPFSFSVFQASASGKFALEIFLEQILLMGMLKVIWIMLISIKQY